MIGKKTLTKVITGALLGGMILSSATMAFADTSTAASGTTSTTKCEQHFKHKKGGNMADAFKSILSTAVTNGTITQAESDKITSYLEQKETDKKAEMEKIKAMTEAERKTYFEQLKSADKTNKKDIFAELVSQGIITQDKADALKKLMPAAPKKEGFKGEKKDMKAFFKTKLDSLVTAGTITQDQEDKIVAYMNQKETDMKAEMEKVKAMTADQKKAYFEQLKANASSNKKADMFADLVSQNIITQDQADAIKKLMPAPKKEGFKGEKKDMKAFLKTKLDSFVTAGTITQDQEDKIVAYMEQKESDMKAQMEKVKTMTDAEKKAYFEQLKTEAKSAKKDIFADLVSQNIITQAQADTISASLKPAAK